MVWGIRTFVPPQVPEDIFIVAKRKLGFLEDTLDFNDLRNPSGNRFEVLKGDYEGQHGIRINDQ